uniref:Photosystem II protein T n=1 Tax=Boodlea composita TaxID=204414 RepID=A0A2H4UXU9_9CHLO|nr:photosystem II protein T [Boodlea composita]
MVFNAVTLGVLLTAIVFREPPRFDVPRSPLLEQPCSRDPVPRVGQESVSLIGTRLTSLGLGAWTRNPAGASPNEEDGAIVRYVRASNLWPIEAAPKMKRTKSC